MGTHPPASCKVLREDLVSERAQIEGVTVVTDKISAQRALKVLQQHADRAHAWDTESADITVGARGESPVTSGRVLCATCYCGDDVDFGNGPRLFVDNDGPAAGLIKDSLGGYFADANFRKVFHNYSFDVHVLRRSGVDVGGFHADTLHMARLLDTSLASWEGQMAKKGELRSTAETGPKGTISCSSEAPRSRQAPATRTIVGAHLGGSQLSRSATQFSTICEAEPTASPVPNGYGLKALSSFFGVADGHERPQRFSEKFGVSSDAGVAAHNCPEAFPDWVHYATTDAVLTWRLFEHLKEKLMALPWRSQVLRDKRLAQEMLKGGALGLAQHDTGKKMWNFYELYMREFGEWLVSLEKTGIAVSRSELERIEQEAERDLQVCHQEFVDRVGRVREPQSGNVVNTMVDLVNIRSSKQVQTLLFGGSAKNRYTDEVLEEIKAFPAPKGSKQRNFELKGLGLTPSNKMKSSTQKGWPSVSTEAIKQLVGETNKVDARTGSAYKQLLERGFSEEEAEDVVRGCRQLGLASKTRSLLSNFARPLQRHASEDGRIHPSWNFDTATGRLACRQPNLQNLPVSAADKYAVRGAFCAAPGMSLVIADYSQLELRVLGHMSNCQNMIEKLTRGGDYHSEVAVEMFPYIKKMLNEGKVSLSSDKKGVPSVKALFTTERGQAKAINFGIVYGKEAPSLAEDLDITTREAEKLVEAWFASKPAVKKWRQNIMNEVTQTGMVSSLLGRVRTMPFASRSSPPSLRRRSLRAAVNFGIQGSAADIVLGASLRLSRNERLAQLGFRVVLQVHDEFVLEGPEDAAPEADELVKELMMEPFKEDSPQFSLRVPLIVDSRIARSLGDVKD
eukprot:CAMPEP_0170583406 /NCGR_PEP_ID=MMETSP0224-20130122/8115_1 /TAXON_ID=285029 /ORGANISM="Togula jolla, Strain CCCM 725" /LENGTH=849 /DNA_ID=CAMNT_0010906725 /DNA_START=79 /DNA_END=2629 /DNA_ORIENTATION=-